MSTTKTKYNEITDFVIPLHRYHYMVRTVIESIYQFYSPRNIYIVTPKRFSKVINESAKKWIVKNVIVLPEETFFMEIYDLHYNDIYDIFNKTKNEKTREFGWWYQQLIKMAAFSQIPQLSDPYIVWDSDLIPLIKWEIYPTNENPHFKFAILQEKAKNEWNTEQYKQSMFKLAKLNMCDPTEGTFVPHHFVFYHDVLIDLINHIEFISNEGWIKSIMKLSQEFFRFSEYRTVASYMKCHYFKLLQYHHFNMFGKYGKRIREPREFLNEMNSFLGELYEISYNDFTKFATYKYKNLPSYLQIEHI